MGGLHAFMGWTGPILTDPGRLPGDVARRLAQARRSGRHVQLAHRRFEALDAGACRRFSSALDSDISMVLDEARPIRRSSRTWSARWSCRCGGGTRARRVFVERRGGRDLAQFGIVQGGVHSDLRRRSLAALREIDFEGYALGGLAVGEPQSEMFRVLDETGPVMPANAPRYLMGVGKPDDLVGAVLRGIDMFDCVLPTRSGRHGQAFTWDGPINPKNTAFSRGSITLMRRACAALPRLLESLSPPSGAGGRGCSGRFLSWHNIAFYQAR
ncbi:MAG: tRNA guanosine(34) transglycosylase Tgt [Alphaproteobacteria bacterium]